MWRRRKAVADVTISDGLWLRRRLGASAVSKEFVGTGETPPSCEAFHAFLQVCERRNHLHRHRHRHHLAAPQLEPPLGAGVVFDVPDMSSRFNSASRGPGAIDARTVYLSSLTIVYWPGVPTTNSPRLVSLLR
ncbi:unnamed protein product [Musa banksii]